MLEMRHPTVPRPAEFRYGAVFVLTLIVVVFLILAPVASWSRAVAFALEGVRWSSSSRHRARQPMFGAYAPW